LTLHGKPCTIQFRKMPANSEATTPRAEFMTPEEVASRLGLHERTVRRAINRGELEAVEFDGSGGYRISEAAFQAWLVRRRARPTDEATA